MGEVAFQAGCVTLENVILTAGGSYECNVVWNTGTPYDGVVASPGTYNVQAYILGVNGMTSEADIQIVG